MTTENEFRRMVLKTLLAKSDYYTLKYVEGYMTAEEFEPIKTQRNAWRVELEQLEAQAQTQQEGGE